MARFASGDSRQGLMRHRRTLARPVPGDLTAAAAGAGELAASRPADRLSAQTAPASQITNRSAASLLPLVAAAATVDGGGRNRPCRISPAARGHERLASVAPCHSGLEPQSSVFARPQKDTGCRIKSGMTSKGVSLRARPAIQCLLRRDDKRGEEKRRCPLAAGDIRQGRFRPPPAAVAAAATSG